MLLVAPDFPPRCLGPPVEPVIAGTMYSNPNYLGGNNLQPGAPQYGGSFGPGAGQPQQQQPGPFAPQPTGFAQAPLQQQYTGYAGSQAPQSSGQLQPQFTGYAQAPQQQAMPTGVPPVPSIPQQFQQQQQQQQPGAFSAAPAQPAPQALAPPAAPVKPQPTGFSEMAASFQTAGGAKPATTPRKANTIPNIRLSFITAQDQAKFETLFKSAVGEGQTTMSGEKARDLLLRSRLDGNSLSHIW